jgi:hypothetical protein
VLLRELELWAEAHAVQAGQRTAGAFAARKGSSSRCGQVSAAVTQLSSSAGGSSPGPGVTVVSAAGTGLAYRMGVIQQIAPSPAKALEAGLGLAQKIAACGPLDIKTTLESAHLSIDQSEAAAFAKLN